MSSKTTFGDWTVQEVVNKVDVGSEVSSQMLITANEIVDFFQDDLTLEAQIKIGKEPEPGDEDYRDYFTVYRAKSAPFYVYHVDEWDRERVWLVPEWEIDEEYKMMVIDARSRFQRRDGPGVSVPVESEGVDVDFGE